MCNWNYINLDDRIIVLTRIFTAFVIFSKLLPTLFDEGLVLAVRLRLLSCPQSISIIHNAVLQ